MKNSGICPKCTSRDIRVHRRRIWGTMIPLGATVFGAAYSSWLVCASCGFVEIWVDDERELDKVRRKLPTYR